MIAIERFLDKVSIDDAGCWLWTAGLSQAGYGQFKFQGRTWPAHRWIYEYYNGPLEKGLELDHLCRVRHCVNPDQVEPVTPKQNAERSPLRNPTHCKRGHEFTEGNTYRVRDERVCRECARERTRRWRANV